VSPSLALENVLQLTLTGIVNGTSYALLGLAFGLILGVTGRFHVAFTVTYALSAYVAAEVGQRYGLPWPVSLVAGGLAGALLGVLMERFVYRMIAAGAAHNGLLMIFVASLGLQIVGRNVIALIWAASSKPLSGFTNVGLPVGPATITRLNIDATLVSWVLIALVAVLLARTTLGRTIRAVRVNPEMSLCIGVDPRRIYLIVFALGSFLAGVSAVFNGIQTSATPDMGLLPFFYALVVAFLAGLTATPLRIGIVGIALGLVESWSSMLLPTQWTALVVFAILFVYVALRPVQWRQTLERFTPHARRPPQLEGL
jgi:branched-subunit amino acid ABC-type transport system permease component